MTRVLPLLLLVACSGGEATAPEATPAAPAADVAPAQPAEAAPTDAAPAAQWACPMHPEVTGAEGDTCSKCGMPLERLGDAPKAEDKAHGADHH